MSFIFGFVSAYPLQILTQLFVVVCVYVLPDELGRSLSSWFMKAGTVTRLQLELVVLAVPCLAVARLAWDRWRAFAVGILAFAIVNGAVLALLLAGQLWANV